MGNYSRWYLCFLYFRNHEYAGCRVDGFAGKEDVPGRLEVVSPFAGLLPENLPGLRLAYDEEALIERSIGAQLHAILPVDSTQNQSILEQLHNFSPSISYNLDEYVRFNTVREAFIEFVMGVRSK